MKPKILSIKDLAQAKEELSKIDVHPAGIEIMALKSIYRLIKFESVDPKTANIIKQEMLARGGDAAVAKTVGMFQEKKTDMILMGNLAEYLRLVCKLRKQTFGDCQKIGNSLQELLFSEFGVALDLSAQLQQEF